MAEHRQHVVRVKHGKPEDRDRITFADLEYQPSNDNRGSLNPRWGLLLIAALVTAAVVWFI